jgi:chromate transporter
VSETLLLRFIILFGGLSLVSVGGAPSILPELHRQVVEIHGWISDRQFANSFALAQTAPGPNIMIVSLIGWHVAGVLGLVVATMAVIAPSSALAWVSGRLYHRFAHADWFPAFKAGLPPVVLGLLAASGVVTGRAAVHSAVGFGVAAAAALFSAFARRNPLWALAGGALVGVLAHRLGLM